MLCDVSPTPSYARRNAQSASAVFGASRARRRGMVRRERQLEIKTRALAERALDADAAAVCVDDLAADVEAETEAAAATRAAAASEFLEGAARFFGRQAGTVILDADVRVSAFDA